MSVPAELRLGGSWSKRDAGLWTLAGAAALALHASVALAFTMMVPAEPDSDAVEESLVVNLSPLPVSRIDSVAAESDVLEPVEDAAEAEPVQPQTVGALKPDAAEAVVPPEPERLAAAEPERVQPVAEPETVEPVTTGTETAKAVPLESPTPEPVEQEVARATELDPEILRPEPVEEFAVEPVPDVAAEIVLPPRVALLPVEKPTVERVKPKPERVTPEPRKAEPRRTVEQPKATKPRKSETAERKPAPQKSVASQRAMASAPRVNPARWNSQVRGAVARRARSVRGMSGTVRVQFVVSASGTIASASISGSSGNPRLDSAALSMVRSARVPAPPAGLGQASFSFAIPLTFK